MILPKIAVILNYPVHILQLFLRMVIWESHLSSALKKDISWQITMKLVDGDLLMSMMTMKCVITISQEKEMIVLNLDYVSNSGSKTYLHAFIMNM